MRTGCAGLLVTAGQTRAFAVAALAFGAVLVGAAAGPPVQAQDPAGPFSLGSPPHDGFSIVEPPAGVPERRRDSVDDGSGRWFFQGWESTPSQDTFAERLYTDAIKALESGRGRDAQRLFERLIAEAPDSPRAGAARQHLGEIYRGAHPEPREAAHPRPVQQTDQAGAAAMPWTGGGGDASATRSSALEVSQPVSRAALNQARVSPGLDGQFLSDAGDRVFFSARSAELGARARGVIQSQARFLLRYPELFAVIEGYADDGAIADAEMIRLSEERAATVRSRLIAEGVGPERILAYGRGREDRVSDCPAPECLAQNRRAVTILLNRRVEGRPLRRAQGGEAEGSTAPSTP
ncbi:OmpA family protein [Hyphomicrobium sp.]|uniref:OmpA family protein n=1 Tax=Hyphomicrobium sp. TaxID=82 RepID=UPI0025BDC26E|nr:OmpA family protein [Hyphomicrobium sp.]MCC7253214.1 OmpA family protein [Hyphomicrobium sp.]